MGILVIVLAYCLLIMWCVFVKEYRDGQIGGHENKNVCNFIEYLSICVRVCALITLPLLSPSSDCFVQSDE